jgi:hypothetical protein
VAITITSDSATISTTPYYLASDSTTATYQTSDVILQVYIDLANMAAGDQYRFRILEKVNGSSARTVYEAARTGAQPGPLVTPSMIVGEGWEVEVTRLAGSDKVIGWSIRTVA